MATETENVKKDPTLVKQLSDAHKKAGSKPPSKKDAEELKKRWLAASAKKEAASAALRTAQSEESAIVQDMVKIGGYSVWAIDGVRYLPSSKGTTCFLRREGFGGETI